ncbi:MAG: hypothetical protein ACYC1Q_11985 [Bacteroidia bacterium]
MTSYSRILIDFIKPLLNGRESEADFLLKARSGMIAWNHVVTDEHKLPVELELKQLYEQLTQAHPDAIANLNMLVIRKLMYFSGYHQFIVKVESRKKPEGSRTLYVESIEADKFRKLFSN